ncbi:hypothetical protein MHK71_07615 [Kocuria indica]|nr:hypothetical protein [Kocuria indica]MCG7432371.1 hypothetical protein [Kocuria indica]
MMVSCTALVEAIPAIMLMMIEITTDVGSTSGSSSRMAAAAAVARTPAAMLLARVSTP